MKKSIPTNFLAGQFPALIGFPHTPFTGPVSSRNLSVLMQAMHEVH